MGVCDNNLAMATGAVTVCDGPVENGRVQLLVTNLPSDAVLAGGKTKNLDSTVNQGWEFMGLCFLAVGAG